MEIAIRGINLISVIMFVKGAVFTSWVGVEKWKINVHAIGLLTVKYVPDIASWSHARVN